LQPEIATALGERKAAHITSVDPDIIAAGNLGCMVQIGRFAKTPIVHTVELLDWATGGPMPPALSGRHLREPAARVAAAVEDEAAITRANTDTNSTGIW
jgi:glycolate oxidase iron-sulfur subunit